MKWIIIALSCCFVEYEYRDQLVKSAREIAWAQIQEAWVKEVVAPHQFSQVLREDEALLLQRASCEHSVCRQSAYQEIEGRGRGAIRMLVWGSWAKDKGLAYYCKVRLEQFSSCDKCHGSGLCQDCGGHSPCTWAPYCSHCSSRGTCNKCDGIGNGKFIYYLPPSKEGGHNIVRKLFP